MVPPKKRSVAARLQRVTLHRSNAESLSWEVAGNAAEVPGQSSRGTGGQKGGGTWPSVTMMAVTSRSDP